MSTRVVVLNGTSSSGKSGLARCLQAVLPDPWLTLGIDRLIQAMPASLQASSDGIEVAADGRVGIGAAFRELEVAWGHGIAAMARAGARVIIDDVFLGGASSQRRWLDALGDLPTLWVGVHCDPTVTAGREIARGNRVPDRGRRADPVGRRHAQRRAIRAGVGTAWAWPGWCARSSR